MSKDSPFGTVSHGRGSGCRGVAEIENDCFTRPSGTKLANLSAAPALEALGYFHRSLQGLGCRVRGPLSRPRLRLAKAIRSALTNATDSAPDECVRGYGFSSVLHQAQPRARAVATGLREFAATGGGPDHVAADHCMRHDAGLAEWVAAGRGLGEFDLFDLQGLEVQAVQPWFDDDGIAAGGLVVQEHWDVNVLEDLATGDADDAVGGLDEVVPFASAVLAAELVGETESGTELLGLNQEACAVGLPCL